MPCHCRITACETAFQLSSRAFRAIESWTNFPSVLLFCLMQGYFFLLKGEVWMSRVKSSRQATNSALTQGWLVWWCATCHQIEVIFSENLMLQGFCETDTVVLGVELHFSLELVPVYCMACKRWAWWVLLNSLSTALFHCPKDPIM